jgi:hypothetical protein
VGSNPISPIHQHHYDPLELVVSGGFFVDILGDELWKQNEHYVNIVEQFIIV